MTSEDVMAVEETAVVWVRMGDLHDDPLCMVRLGHAPEALERYKDVWVERPQEMEPLWVRARPGGGYAVIAGYGRKEAALRAGLEEVPVRVLVCSDREALLWASRSNGTHGQPMAAEDVTHNLRLLMEHCPDLSEPQLARLVGRSTRVVRHFKRGERVRRALRAAGVRIEVHQAVLDEIGAAPEEHWPALGKAAAERGWSKYEARLAVENLTDPRFSQAAKLRLLEGVVSPAAVPQFEGRALARALDPAVLERLSAQHLVAIEVAPPRYWEQLAQNVVEGGWSVDLTQRMAHSLLDAGPGEAQDMLADPHVPVRHATEGPEVGQPVIALETVLKNQGPAHLDPNRARAALRHLFTAMGAAQRFDPMVAIGAFGPQDWPGVEAELAALAELTRTLQAALAHARAERPHVVGAGR